MACVCTLKYLDREITVAEFFGDKSFEVVDGSEITPGLCIMRACMEPAVLYLHEYAAKEFRECIEVAKPLDWVLELPVDSVLATENIEISKKPEITFTMSNKKHTGDAVIFTARFDPRQVRYAHDIEADADFSFSDAANIEAVQPKAKSRGKIKKVIENTKPEL